VLIAVAAPSLNSARQSSQYGVCLARLGAIGAATAVYTKADPDEQSLPVHPLFAAQDPENLTYIGAYEWGGKSGVGRPGFVPGAEPEELRSKFGTLAGFGPGARPLNRLLYPHGFRDNLSPAFSETGATLDTKLDLPAFRCPADNGPPGGAHCPDWLANPQQSSYDHFGTSYAANVFMISYGTGSLQMSNSPYLRPLSRVPDPARTFNYEENIGRWAWASRRERDDCYWLGPGVDPGPTKVVRGWHSKGWTYNFGYVDGHADRQTLLIDGTEDSQGYSWHYLTERVFEDDVEQQQLQCIIVRGEGNWQKDTLPDPFVETPLRWLGSGRASFEDCVISE